MHHFLIIEKQPVIAAGVTSFISAKFPTANITAVAPEDLVAQFLYHKYICYIYLVQALICRKTIK